MSNKDPRVYSDPSTMKLIVELTEDNSSPAVRRFISLWKTRHQYKNLTELTLGEALELLVAVSYTVYHEDSDGRFFNTIIRGEELLIAWDGDELIDITLFEICQNLKHRFASGRIFSDEIASV